MSETSCQCESTRATPAGRCRDCGRPIPAPGPNFVTWAEEAKRQRVRADAAEAQVARLTVLTDLDANRIQEIEARALDYYSRAETAEAEVQRLTRECLDREATETEEAGIADGTIFAGEQSRAEAAEARVRRYAESVGWAKLLEELERLHSVEVKLADARERLRRCEERLAAVEALAVGTEALAQKAYDWSTHTGMSPLQALELFRTAEAIVKGAP